MISLRLIGLLIFVCVMACEGGCSSREDGNLSSIPATFTGTLEVQPQSRQTKELYLAMVSLAQRYGMDPRGDGAKDGRHWQVQILCAQQYVGGAASARNGELILFDLAIYGFQKPQHYKNFKAEMLELMKPFGVLSSLAEHPRLSQEELLKRGKHTCWDVTSQCSPPK